MDDVEQTLEDEGVHSFAKSFDELLQTLSDKAATFKNGEPDPVPVLDVPEAFTSMVLEAFGSRPGPHFTLVLSGGPTARACYENLCAATTAGGPKQDASRGPWWTSTWVTSGCAHPMTPTPTSGWYGRP